MKALQYKENSKTKIGVVIVAILLLCMYYMEGSSFFALFSEMKSIWIFALIRDIIPAILVLAIGVSRLIGKNSQKLVMILLMMFYMTNMVGQFTLLTQGTIQMGFLFTAENIVNFIVNVLAIVFAVMVLCGSLKASYGAFATTLVKSIMLIFHSYVLTSFVFTILGVLLAMFVLLGMEDFEEKPLKKIRGEKIGFARRNVGSCVILTIMTLGIFGIVWLVKICKDLRRLHGDENPVGGEVLLYTLVPFYSVYWAYDKGKQMFEDSQKRGGNLTDRKYIYMFMNIIFMQLFTLGFIQTQLNSYQSR